MRFTSIILLLLAVFGLKAQEETPKLELETQIDSVSYAYGMQKAFMRKNDLIDEVNLDAFIQGFSDVYLGGAKQIDPRDGNLLIKLYQGAIQKIQYDATKAEGAKFMENYRKKEGVKELEGGVLYRQLEKGRGVRVTENGRFMVNMKVLLPDGTVALNQSDRKRPKPYYLKDFVPGMQTAIKEMQQGDWWEIVVPHELAFGRRLGYNGSVPQYSTVIFEFRLVEVQ